MKTYMKLFALILMLPFAASAQKTVSASSIIQSINDNKAVSITDAEITGDLDFTKLNNMKLEPNNSQDKNYISTVTVPVSFSNCRFTGKVLGYVNPDEEKLSVKNKPVYNANFTAAVSFEKCTFTKAVAFKYSVFSDKASFAGSSFNDDAMFKYTKFNEGPKYNGATFKEEASFKYVDFPSGFDFSNATFSNIADFKYAQLKHAGSFENTHFEGGTSFKYAAFSKDVKLKGAVFNGSNDFKYTTLNDKKTTAAELVNN